MKTNRRNFLGGLVASLSLTGCKSPWLCGEPPRLRLGVISDIHVTTPESTAGFRRALAYFRDRGADAVLVAGDLADWGLQSGFAIVSEAWRDVFPDDRAPDGRPVAKLFVTGNHDFEGWDYSDMSLDMHVQGYSEQEALVRFGMKACWEKAFGEPYADIRLRRVNGFDFVSAEWMVNGEKRGDEIVAKWLTDHAAELAGDHPFFFFRHAPVPATVVTSDPKPTALTQALSRFPNAIVFNGHTHWTLNDERAIWQGAFTAISIPSLSYTSLPKEYENGSDDRSGRATAGMFRLPSRDNLEEAQGYFVSVWEDRMEVERYDFTCMTDAAMPWIVPLGLGCDRPYVPARRAERVSVPHFPKGAELMTYVTNADTRAGLWTIFMTLEFPSATAANGRVFDYEVRAVREADNETVAMKRFLSPGFYKLPEAEPAMQKFRFDAMDLPEFGRYRLKVYPRNCFGLVGEPLVSHVFESKPGKSTEKREAKKK